MHIRRRFLTVAACAAAVVVSSCKATDYLGTQYAVQSARLVAYGITGTPTYYPTAVSVVGVYATRALLDPSGTASFDVVFDLQSPTQVKVIPVRAFAVAPTLSLQSIGLQVSPTPFDSLRTAPNSAYRYDSTTVIARGQTLFVETRPSSCTYSLSQSQYAKLTVDSIDAAARLLFLRVVLNPNCGKRDVVGTFAPVAP
jgi:hypothetical protein